MADSSFDLSKVCTQRWWARTLITMTVKTYKTIYAAGLMINVTVNKWLYVSLHLTFSMIFCSLSWAITLSDNGSQLIRYLEGVYLMPRSQNSDNIERQNMPKIHALDMISVTVKKCLLCITTLEPFNDSSRFTRLGS